jgi:hypothetical protein
MPEVLWAREVAALLRINVNTVKRLSPSELPYFTVGARRDRRYLRSDVDAYIERYRVAG